MQGTPFKRTPAHSRGARSVAVCGASFAEHVAIAACAFALPAPAEGDTVEIQLTPAGAFKRADGGEMKVDAWRIDKAIASRVIDRFKARKTPPVIDYEHQTLHKEDNGQPAPAAGWMRSLTWREGSGLYAAVELTARAKQHIADGEYRYFSPVFSFDPKTGAVLAMHMGALTNFPAIDGMEPLALRAAATFCFNEEIPVNKLQLAICAALALAATATEDECIAALTAVKPQLDELQGLRQALGIDPAVAGETAIAACTALRTKADQAKPDPSQFVAVATFEAVKNDLAVLTAKTRDREVSELVETGLRDGRLLPAQKDWATELGKSNLAALTGYLASTQPIAALRGSQTGGKKPEGGNGLALSEEELAVCTATGITPDAFKAARSAS